MPVTPDSYDEEKARHLRALYRDNGGEGPFPWSRNAFLMQTWIGPDGEPVRLPIA